MPERRFFLFPGTTLYSHAGSKEPGPASSLTRLGSGAMRGGFWTLEKAANFPGRKREGNKIGEE